LTLVIEVLGEERVEESGFVAFLVMALSSGVGFESCELLSAAVIESVGSLEDESLPIF